MKQLVPVPQGVKGIIFDLDGTLVDSMPLHLEAYNFAVAPYGISYTQEVFQSRAGMPTIATFERIAEDHGIADMDIELACARKREFFGQNLEKITLIEPVADVMRRSHGNIPMAIGTGSYRKTVDKVVNLFGLLDYIGHVVTADDVTRHKPEPETFLKCAQLLGIAPADCVVYEDGDPGVQAAIAAGMQVVDVRDHL